MIKFGTGGWRAIIGDEFTKKNVQIVAQAMAMKIKKENKKEHIIMGYDSRFLSKEALIWVCEVMAYEGIKCYFVNKSVPTPLVMYYVMKNGFDYGMMVTASHNPAIYNGIKVFTYGGCDADKNQTDDIEKYMENVDVSQIKTIDYKKAKDKKLIEDIYPMNEYIDNILDNIDTNAIKNANIKVVLDPMYGVSRTALSTILLSTRCEMYMIHQEHDTLFGGKMPSPNKETLMLLKHTVMDKKYDIGIATDGDADRLGVIDETGRFLHPNDILVMLYYYLLKYKGWSGDVVRNLATTHMLDKLAEKFGQKCHEVAVGFKNVSAKMTETYAILGGESSGGLTVKGHINGKDGVYAAILLIEMMAVTGKKLSQIVQEIQEECGEIFMQEMDYSFSEQKKQEIKQMLFVDKKLPSFDGYNVQKVTYVDGCKVYFENGWLIARFSGTEPLIRIFCEMPNSRDTDIIIKRFEKLLGISK